MAVRHFIRGDIKNPIYSVALSMDPINKFRMHEGIIKKKSYIRVQCISPPKGTLALAIMEFDKS
jgi:hypothetical protein